MILSYPVITGYEFAHRNSINHLCGKKKNKDEEIRRFSLEYHVDETTVPAFIWHTFDDKVVPIQNSLLLADALTRAHIPFELHIFPKGPHGGALCTTETWSENPAMIMPNCAEWIRLAVTWIRSFS
jgi:acetyl esterase/lipase